MRFLSSLLDLIYVPLCPSCDVRVPANAGLCATCVISLVELGSACPRCAEPLEGPQSFECGRCRKRPPPYASLTAPYRYGGELAAALQRLKFQRRPDIARSLGPMVTPCLSATIEMHGIELLMPIPLHWRRMSSRGFNQAALLLDYAAAGLEDDVDIDRVSLRRTRRTTAQAGLDARARIANVDGAFAVVAGRRSRVAQRRILLVDDISTTGATIAAAARALLASGARSVHGFAVGRTET